jgi:hypothetical protein
MIHYSLDVYNEVFWWRCHVLDIECVRDSSDSQRSGQHRVQALSHRVRGVAPVDRALLPADNAACRQPGGESLVPPGFLLALHAPTARARSDGPAGEGRTALTCLAFNTAQVYRLQAGERLASVAIRRLRRHRQRELGSAPAVLYVAGCYGVFSLEELLDVLGSAPRESLLP